MTRSGVLSVPAIARSKKVCAAAALRCSLK